MKYIVEINDENFGLVFNLIKDKMEKQILKSKTNYYTVIHKNTDQISFVFDGIGIVYLNGNPYNIKKGSFIIIPKKCSHQFTAISNTLTIYHFHYPNDNINNDINVISEGQHD